MATNVGELIAYLKLNNAEFKRGIDKATRDSKEGVSKIGKQLDGVDTKLKQVSTGFSALGVVASLTALAYGLKNVIELSERQRKAVLGMETVMRSMGRYTPELSMELRTLAETQQQLTNYSDEATLEGTKFLLTYKQIGDEVLPDSVKTMQDLAALMGGDVVRAANMLGKAAMGMTGELRRVGITVDAATFKAEGYAGVLRQIQAQVGGQAKAMSDPWTQLGNVIGDLREKFGDFVNIIGKPFANAAIEQIRMWNIQLKRWLDLNEKVIAQKVPQYVEKTAAALRKIWDIITYDPYIIKYGLVGLAVGGKKWAIILGVLGHVIKYIINIGKAIALASQGLMDFDFDDVFDFKRIDDKIKELEGKFGALGDNNYELKFNLEKGSFIDLRKDGINQIDRMIKEIEERIKGEKTLFPKVNAFDKSNIKNQVDDTIAELQGQISSLKVLKLYQKIDVDADVEIGDGSSKVKKGFGVDETTEEYKDSMSSMYDYLKFKSDGYYEYEKKKIEDQTAIFLRHTQKEELAKKYSVEKIKDLDLAKISNVSEIEKAYVSMYDSLKFEADGYYEHELQQIEKRRKAFFIRTKDEITANKIAAEEIKKLNEEKLTFVSKKDQASTSIYDQLKFEAQGYYEFRKKLIEKETELARSRGVDETLIKEYTNNKLKELDVERFSFVNKADEATKSVYDSLRFEAQGYYEFRKDLIKKEEALAIASGTKPILVAQQTNKKLKELEIERLSFTSTKDQATSTIYDELKFKAEGYYDYREKLIERQRAMNIQQGVDEVLIAESYSEKIKQLEDDKFNYIREKNNERLNVISQLYSSIEEKDVGYLNNSIEILKQKYAEYAKILGADHPLLNTWVYDEAKKTYDDYLSHVNKSLKTIKSFTERTMDSIEDTISDFSLDALTGKFKSFEDYLIGFGTSIARIWSDIIGQLGREALTDWTKNVFRKTKEVESIAEKAIGYSQDESFTTEDLSETVRQVERIAEIKNEASQTSMFEGEESFSTEGLSAAINMVENYITSTKSSTAVKEAESAVEKQRLADLSMESTLTGALTLETNLLAASVRELALAYLELATAKASAYSYGGGGEDNLIGSLVGGAVSSYMGGSGGDLSGTKLGGPGTYGYQKESFGGGSFLADTRMQHGGKITELIYGIGQETGKKYSFGESGVEEFVVPSETMKDITSSKTTKEAYDSVANSFVGAKEMFDTSVINNSQSDTANAFSDVSKSSSFMNDVVASTKSVNDISKGSIEKNIKSTEDIIHNLTSNVGIGEVENFESTNTNKSVDDILTNEKSVGELLKNVVAIQDEKRFKTFDYSMKNGGKISELVYGVGQESGKTYRLGEGGSEEFVVPSSSMKGLSSGGNGGSEVNVDVKVINKSGVNMNAQQGRTFFDGKKVIAEVILDKMTNNRRYRQAMTRR